jgi:hypothetical protein
LLHRYLGYNNRGVPDAVSSAIESQIRSAYKLIKPIYSYTPKLIERILGNKVFLEGSFKLMSRILSDALSGCNLVLVFIVTIGKDLENEASKLTERGELIKGYILDAIGSLAVESAADKMQENVKRIIEDKGYHVTMRYSPGYCDWNIKQQEHIFQALGRESVGVTLNESYMMIPQKSISGILGIGRFGNAKFSPCVRCDRKAHCSYKRNRLWL